MGKSEALAVIEELASRGVFRERDLKPWRVSHSWLEFALGIGMVTQQGHGVWSRPGYSPSRYEVLQLRFPRAVFWGPSALWLLGASDREPEPLWIAIANNARPPTRLDEATVVIRTRRLEADVTSCLPTGRALALRVYNRERAQADIERTACSRLLARALEPGPFLVAIAPGSPLPSAPRPSRPRLLVHLGSPRHARQLKTASPSAGMTGAQRQAPEAWSRNVEPGTPTKSDSQSFGPNRNRTTPSSVFCRTSLAGWSVLNGENPMPPVPTVSCTMPRSARAPVGSTGPTRS